MGLWFLFWLHQGRIPHRTCRFYLLLAGAPKDEGEGLCGAPLLHPLDSTSSPRGCPLRRGISAAAVDRDIVSCIQVQVVTPQFRILFGYLCSGLDRSRFNRFRWAYVFRFSLLVGWTVRSCGYLWFWLYSFVGFALTAIGSFLLAGNGMAISVSLEA